jgi:hypothetical protein
MIENGFIRKTTSSQTIEKRQERVLILAQLSIFPVLGESDEQWQQFHSKNRTAVGIDSHCPVFRDRA